MASLSRVRSRPKTALLASRSKYKKWTIITLTLTSYRTFIEYSMRLFGQHFAMLKSVSKEEGRNRLGRYALQNYYYSLHSINTALTPSYNRSTSIPLLNTIANNPSHETISNYSITYKHGPRSNHTLPLGTQPKSTTVYMILYTTYTYTPNTAIPWRGYLVYRLLEKRLDTRNISIRRLLMIKSPPRHRMQVYSPSYPLWYGCQNYIAPDLVVYTNPGRSRLRSLVGRLSSR